MMHQIGFFKRSKKEELEKLVAERELEVNFGAVSAEEDATAYEEMRPLASFGVPQPRPETGH